MHHGNRNRTLISQSEAFSGFAGPRTPGHPVEAGRSDARGQSGDARRPMPTSPTKYAETTAAETPGRRRVAHPHPGRQLGASVGPRRYPPRVCESLPASRDALARARETSGISIPLELKVLETFILLIGSRELEGQG